MEIEIAHLGTTTNTDFSQHSDWDPIVKALTMDGANRQIINVESLALVIKGPYAGRRFHVEQYGESGGQFRGHLEKVDWNGREGNEVILAEGDLSSMADFYDARRHLAAEEEAIEWGALDVGDQREQVRNNLGQ